ncbi:12382_t:CDS:2 [Ambispora gerdemannii]|uniref:12382_t:CDS:1 n=1 Tax=Ambispora gerdemannii TaxID=144530 RepID=A0A9N8UYK8_9GLOM|nr:12382_t:CDS:2 [Ambispora gerdemannii]
MVLSSRKEMRRQRQQESRQRSHLIKAGRIKQIQVFLDKCNYVWLFKLPIARTSCIKSVRQDLVGSRIVIGSNRLTAIALGKDAASEYKKNLHLISMRLVGNVCLLFTNLPLSSVKKYAEEKQVLLYARPGNIATRDVKIPAGPITRGDPPAESPFIMESSFKKLGLPVQCLGGNLFLEKEHTVCLSGQALSVDQANLLKLLQIRLNTFKLDLVCVWNDNKVTEASDVE